MDRNRYFTPNTNDSKLAEMLARSIQDRLEPISVDGTIGMFKLKLKDTQNYSILKDVPEYTYEGINILFKGSNWQDPNV